MEDSVVESVVESVIETVIEEPLVESVVEEPVVEPIVEEPVVEPIVEEPVVEPVVEPIIEEPVVEPIVEEPVVEPIVEEPVVEPVIEEPVVEQIVVEPVVEPVIEKTVVEEPIQNNIPKLVFIVPYRDREQQQIFFKKHMQEILSDYNQTEYKIYYIHQTDQRPFNRGALKNIGFLFVKEKYPNDYQNITLVFNDVDTMPLSKNFLNYETKPGTVKHFYGYTFALGGIVSMNAKDFENINGYPNLWAWGYEDNMLQYRVLQISGLVIDRSQFYPLLDKNILQLKDGLERIVNRGEFDRYLEKTTEGIDSIYSLQYQFEDITGFVNVNTFETGKEVDPSKDKIHDLRQGNQPFKKPVPKKKGRLPLFKMVLR